MNYRDFFKNKKVAALLPEGVDPKEFAKGIIIETASTKDAHMAAVIAASNLKDDSKYYSKLYEQYEEQEEHCGACEDDFNTDGTGVDSMKDELDADDGSGYAKMGGALAVPHLGDPIKLGKIIQVGDEFGHGPASGEQSGMTSCNDKGTAKDKGGIPANEQGDKEPLTAGGKKLDSSIASKSVGGPVTPGDGQKQGGPNSQGTIAATAKLNEKKEKVRNIVKEVLKEIRFDSKAGKWVRIDEAGHKAGCKCAFCSNKGKFGKKKEEEDESKEEMDEATVNMKMGPAHKIVQPTLAKTADMDWPRSNQYDPEISEMYDEEEVVKMNERYVALTTAPRNLSESEITEMKTLREKIDKLQISKRNFGLSPGGTEPSLYQEENWIKGAVNPEHKGYCTPMTKSTCTPHRKAFAKRAKAHDLEEERDATMKMGPSYRVVAPRQARVLDDDQAHRDQDTADMRNESAEEEDECMQEAGIGAVQHSSYRTANHGNMKQDPKQRWADDVDEGEKKVSKVVKTIKKGQKPKKNLPTKFKHETPRHTTSGVHKRKT